MAVSETGFTKPTLA